MSNHFGMARATRGRTMMQMPMQCYKFSEWISAVRESLSEEAEKRTAAQASLDRRDRLSKESIEKGVAAAFPDAEALLMNAFILHVKFYGLIANTESGFDLDIKPHEVIFDGKDGYVVIFATIKSDACVRLRGLAGVEATVKWMTKLRRERLKSQGFSGRIDKSDALMDLLVAALPHTTHTVGMSTPRGIVDFAIANDIGLHSREPT